MFLRYYDNVFSRFCLQIESRLFLFSSVVKNIFEWLLYVNHISSQMWRVLNTNSKYIMFGHEPCFGLLYTL